MKILSIEILLFYFMQQALKLFLLNYFFAGLPVFGLMELSSANNNGEIF